MVGQMVALMVDRRVMWAYRWAALKVEMRACLMVA
jgi:hypothetical protein